MEEQLRYTQQELAQERTANKVKDDYLAIHNTTHPFYFSDIYVLTLCNYRH
jgi:hypothetical protein